MSGKRRQAGVRGSGGKKAKQPVKAELSVSLGEKTGREKVRRAWESGETAQCGPVIVDSVPFQHCVIRSFIENSEFLDGLKDELLALNFQDKSNDLYKFQQSEDLKSRKEPHISALRKVLFEHFRQWLSEVTKVDLESTVDISCAQYNYTDILLCHDDELEGRRFAFILYLVPEWTEEDGGSLDLYSTDEKAQPGHIVKSLIPSWNTLVFFEVSPVSFHQVSEVLSEGKCRLSVSGWFHGSSLERPPRSLDPVPARSPHIPYDHEILYEWINPVYLSVEYQAQIQEEFEDTSEILLKDFLKEEKFSEVSAALQTRSVEWELLGPPNRRRYERTKGDLPDVLRSCMELLKSEAFFLLLSNLTGLKLHFLAASNDESDEGEGSSEPNGRTSAQGDDSDHTRIPVCSGELRHWEHGHYTMIYDDDPERQAFALDLLWFCGCEDWESEYGGFTSYIAKEEDEELLTVYPENNCLALVYRDKETMRFVKHINHKSVQRNAGLPNHKGFWDFAFVYYE
ncbi:PREDICTED: prolyl 3-hydroxylase OGFOD1 isoform X2 [Nanorana parkeri]|uniref:prolyl 3-hydroxylase OGFOD1 isoform X2 n=1 Tax=Nanorana parkeri TaxID=125878 RepID=UPI000854CFDF|nr:PREDICTED: prolyl 3-hydroxylase OGFOD1 isoform X2 [Nanorana parkeri]